MVASSDSSRVGSPGSLNSQAVPVAYSSFARHSSPFRSKTSIEISTTPDPSAFWAAELKVPVGGAFVW
jgi:hypothetical protein